MKKCLLYFSLKSLKISVRKLNCFGARGARVRELNHASLFTKYLLQCQKMDHKELNINEFTQRCL